ncbi:MAG: peptide-methionine (S)-S-oxide reductase MsrA [Candidatus Obscuribacterales bacterium]|nr:peptide-methionine (S)-S-oxide reductase MsrA [Candidatus Obscuribacterales bacterium]
MKGVLETAVGYCGGKTENPSYPLVCSGTTGHAETVEVAFDPDILAYDELLRLFWQMHDPTQGMRQGFNIGSQYRSAIYCQDDEQLKAAEISRDRLEAQLGKKISTEIKLLSKFWKAEEYHQQYYEKKGYSPCRLAGV